MEGIDLPLLYKIMDATNDLVQELRRQGLATEAAIVVRALDIATAAVSQKPEVYLDALVSLHNLACGRLHDIEREIEEDSAEAN